VFSNYILEWLCTCVLSSCARGQLNLLWEPLTSQSKNVTDGQSVLVSHVLCACEAIAHLRFCHLDQFFMEPGDYDDAPISRVLQFMRSAGLLKE
jgi:hypothetical protein